MALRALVSLVGGGMLLFVIFQSLQKQASVTVNAAPNATNVTAYDTATQILQSSGYGASQFPVFGIILLMAGVLGAAKLVT